MNDTRADSFLRLIRRSQRGKLKIYLGYAAGVGKTYQMLLEAHRLKADGIDSVVGFVETHGRAETDALVAGLELIPRRRVTHRGIEIEEMDLDAILARHPHVVLVDELAHTNVPGSANSKRWQDVEEILAAGIHVISTMNVQHLESLYETVERATAVRVRERVPDRVVAEADEIVNVDVTVEDLRRRLREGRVYTAERIETALENFFKPTNLEQLRELTLREVAAQIDSHQRDLLEEDLPSSPDQVMVCLSSKGPNSVALLRYGSRLAGRLNRNWYAIHVQTSRDSPTVIDATTQRLLSNTLTLAQQLGATVFTYKGDDIVKTILQFAREYRVGHIVIGAPGAPLPFLRRLMGGQSVMERLMLEGRGITVVAIDTKEIPEEHPNIEAAGPREAAKTGEAAEPRPPAIKRPVALSDIIRVLTWDMKLDKEDAMQLLLDAWYPAPGAERDAAWRALMEREQLGGTFVGEDVALPHARIAGLRHSRVALGISLSGIEERESGLTARIMLMLLSPAEPPEAHLTVLGLISRMAQDDQWRREILTVGSPDDAMNAIHDWEQRLSARASTPETTA